MKKFLFTTLFVIASVYIVVCLLVYIFQEKLIFFPQQLSDSYSFPFEIPFQEITLTAADNTKLHALLFTTQHPKGVILYLHGNAGSLASWGGAAHAYTELQYDVYMIDYRGYGKSEGSVSSERQLMEDMQLAYIDVKKRYAEEQIVILGYSIGTGPAAQLAATNKPRLLILQAPYYSLADVARKVFPILPTFLLKYRFNTYQYLPQCSMPAVLFHGSKDEVIPFASSLKLKELFKSGDTLIALPGLGHNGMTFDARYRVALKDILK